MKVASGTENGSRGTISGSTKNRSHQGSLKNHFLRTIKGVSSEKHGSPVADGSSENHKAF